MDKCVIPVLVLVFWNPLTAPFSLWWVENLKNNPMRNEDNQDAWDGRVRHFETRVSEVVDHRSAQTERRVEEQIRELRAGMATEAQIAETRQQITELRTETTQTRQQIAELGSGVTQMRGQIEEMCVVLRGLASQRA